MSLRDLDDGEYRIEAPDEDLWRLVHPNHLDASGLPAKAAFSDKRLQLSVIRSSKRTAAEAYEFHLRSHDCAGAWPLKVRTVDAGGSRAVDDAAADSTVAPGHAYIDYRDLTKAQWTLLRTALVAEATTRGREHP